MRKQLTQLTSSVARAPMQAPNGMTQDVPISPMEESYDGMTVAEWDDLGLPMKWSIFKDDGDDVPFEQRQLDLSAPVEDGEYDAVYGFG